MKIDLDHLRVFYEVAKAGSFTAAAEILHISQPAVSRSMSILEDRLGTALFERHARGIRLTPEGERLFEFAVRVVEEANLFVKIIRDKSDEPQGELKIVTMPHMGASWLMGYLAEFLRKYPLMRVRLIGRLDRVDVSEGDVAIRPYMDHHPNLIQHRLKAFPMGLWAHPKYLEEFGMPQSAQDLDNHRLISYEDYEMTPYGNVTWIHEVGADAAHPRKPFFRANSLEGLVNAAKHGMGIAELSGEWPSVKESELVPVLPDLQGPLVEMYYIYPQKMAKSKRITALGDFLLNALQDSNS